MKFENGLITLETENLLYCFDTRGVVVKFINKRTGGDFNMPGSMFAYMLPEKGETQTPPNDVSYENGMLAAEFTDIKFFILPQEFPGHLRFTVTDIRTLDENGPGAFGRFVFGAAKTNAVTDDFTATSVSLNMKCTTIDYPGQGANLGIVIHGGLPGSMLSGALTADNRDDLPERIRETAKHLTKDEFPLSEAGGANAASFKDTYADYDIYMEKTPPDDIGAWLDGLLAIGVRQINFHQGGLYRHGDFYYRPELFPNGVTDFKKKIIEPMQKRDMIPCLHTYAAMVDAESRYVTPVPSKDLDSIKIYSLADDICETAGTVPVTESTAGVEMVHHWVLCNSFYLAIDKEIIHFSDVYRSGGAFLKCERGAFGTQPAEHKKGAPVRHLCGAYGKFLCVPGSPLFTELAVQTAAACNEAGIKALYLDGLDFLHHEMNVGVTAKSLTAPLWYYEALFVQEILRHADNPLILEYSTMSHNLWYARSRYIALDYPTTAYQHFIDWHINENRRLWMLTPELGWIHLYPNADGFIDLPNWGVTNFYEDDVDYLGSLCVLYNAGLSYQTIIKPEQKNQYPVYIQNEKRLRLYGELRDGGHFTKKFRKDLIKTNRKYRLIEKSGEYLMQPFERLTALSRFLNEDAYCVDNPLEAENFKIRLESRHTAAPYDYEDMITVAAFDRDKQLDSDTAIVFNEPLNLKGREALGLWVKGCGRGYLQMRLESAFSGNYICKGNLYHILPLDFTGWRYVTLCEPNNGDFPHMLPGGSAAIYRNFRFVVDYSKISRIDITLTDGAEGVYVSDLRALPVSPEPVINPGINVNGRELRFSCALKPGTYLEYLPGNDYAVISDIYGNNEICEAQGEIDVPEKGKTAVTLLGEAGGTRRLACHLIVYGEAIKQRKDEL